MIKIWAIFWIILTVILIASPIGIILFFLSRHVRKFFSIIYDRVKHIQVLKKFKEDIIFRRRRSPLAPQEQPDSGIVVSTEKDFELEIYASPQEVDIIQNIVDAEVDNTPTSVVEDMVIDKESFLKNKKLLEKIVYEALVLRKEWNFDAYEKKLIEWLALDPNDRDLNRFLADYYFSTSNHKKALSLLKKIVELDPKDHKAIWQIGEIYLSAGDFETAELLIEKAVSINPANPKYYVSMVELYYNTDRKHDAIAQLEQIVRLRPTNPSYMLTLADLYMDVDDLDNAQKYYFRVLEHEPSNEKARKILKGLISE